LRGRRTASLREPYKESQRDEKSEIEDPRPESLEEPVEEPARIQQVPKGSLRQALVLVRDTHDQEDDVERQ
jgi:hypothetical protein